MSISILSILTPSTPFIFDGDDTVTPGLLLHSPAEIIRQLLIDKGVGETPGAGSTWPVYATAEPNAPDNCITVIDTTGQEDPRIFPTGEAPTHSGIQILVRSTTHQVGFRKAFLLRETITKNVKNEEVTVEGTDYLVVCLVKVSQVLPLGKDRTTPTSRSRFSINALTPIRRFGT